METVICTKCKIPLNSEFDIYEHMDGSYCDECYQDIIEAEHDEEEEFDSMVELLDDNDEPFDSSIEDLSTVEEDEDYEDDDPIDEEEEW